MICLQWRLALTSRVICICDILAQHVRPKCSGGYQRIIHGADYIRGFEMFLAGWTIAIGNGIRFRYMNVALVLA